jgi:hypothetical protein
MTDITKTAIYHVLEKVPQNEGYVFSDVMRKGLLNWAQNAGIVPESGLLTQFQETFIAEMSQGQKGKDKVRDKLVELGVSFNGATQFVADGKLNRNEVLLLMADVGENKYGSIVPGKEAIETIAIIARQNGITDPLIHKRLAQFELGASEKVLQAFDVNPYHLVGRDANLRLREDYNVTHKVGILESIFERAINPRTLNPNPVILEQDQEFAKDLKEGLKKLPDLAQNFLSQSIRWFKEAAEQAEKPQASATAQRPSAP